MAKPTNQRSRYFVERQVQGALGLRIAMHWGLFLVATALLTTFLRVIGNVEFVSIVDVVALALREQLTVFVVLLALLPWFVHDALKLSNRFAGPMVRLRGALRELNQEGATLPLKFRRGDFWSDIAEEFNELRSQIDRDRSELAHLRSQLAAANSQSPAAPLGSPMLTLPVAAAASEPTK